MCETLRFTRAFNRIEGVGEKLNHGEERSDSPFNRPFDHIEGEGKTPS